ncbi:hypothetical protein, conserved [Eimeria necatrix]|uniref:Glutaredoxin domain-containing protein n=1 Tax=Eimeria necatrix TaxID=51315 RepID=U6N0N6_9EIME|nr:hypothetical protein, conserved [Eimeria necatrix]CDJ68319.1 hypothetical protein, conserved [Eimeria necatrix]
MLFPAAVRTLAGLATATMVLALLPVSCSEAPAAQDEPSLETRFEVSSEAYPTPKAPPPTEVTRATREEGDNATVVASPEALKEKLQAKQAVVSAWESRIGLLLENVAQENAKKKEPFMTGEKGIKVVSLTFFSVAFVALLFMFLYEFKSRPPSADTIFAPTVQPQEVPEAVSGLLAANKTVVFLADDCPVCLTGIRDLQKHGQSPVVVLLMGHRLERQVRSYLQDHYSVRRLPAIFFEGVPFLDFASATADQGLPSISAPKPRLYAPRGWTARILE